MNEKGLEMVNTFKQIVTLEAQPTCALNLLECRFVSCTILSCALPFLIFWVTAKLQLPNCEFYTKFFELMVQNQKLCYRIIITQCKIFSLQNFADRIKKIIDIEDNDYDVSGTISKYASQINILKSVKYIAYT